MIEVNISSDIYRFSRLAAQLSKKEIAKATSDAINRTIMIGRTVARDEVKKVYNIPSRYLKYVDINRSKPSTLRGEIYARTTPVPMDAFNPKFKVISSGGVVQGIYKITRRGKMAAPKSNSVRSGQRKQVGVTIEVKKGQRSVVPYAFLIPGAKPRVFARGNYATDNSYSFIRRHERKENESGNDSVNNMLSTSVYGAVINNKVEKALSTKVFNEYQKALGNALQRQIDRGTR